MCCQLNQIINLVPSPEMHSLDAPSKVNFLGTLSAESLYILVLPGFVSLVVRLVCLFLFGGVEPVPCFLFF